MLHTLTEGAEVTELHGRLSYLTTEFCNTLSIFHYRPWRIMPA